MRPSKRTSPPGATGRTGFSAWNRPGAGAKTAPIPAGSAPWSSGPTSRRASPGASSRACPSPGASRRATTTWAATTWSGRATWWKRPADCWPPAPARTRAGSSSTSGPPRKRTATGPRTCGWTVTLLGRRPDGRDGLSDPAGRHGETGGSARRGTTARATGRWCKAAAAFVVRNGPVTQQDRWEEDPGYSPFTLAVEIAALLAAADMAVAAGEAGTAGYLRETADDWNASHRALDLRARHGPGRADRRGRLLRAHRAARDLRRLLHGGGLRRHQEPPAGQSLEAASHIVSPDALALVRFGLGPRTIRAS